MQKLQCKFREEKEKQGSWDGPLFLFSPCPVFLFWSNDCSSKTKLQIHLLLQWWRSQTRALCSSGAAPKGTEQSPYCPHRINTGLHHPGLQPQSALKTMYTNTQIANWLRWIARGSMDTYGARQILAITWFLSRTYSRSASYLMVFWCSFLYWVCFIVHCTIIKSTLNR